MIFSSAHFNFTTMNKGLLAAFIILSMLAACHPTEEKTKPVEGAPVSIPKLSYEPVRTLPHDTNSFTEGLLMHDGKLFESTGYVKELPQTRSLFGIVDPATGKINIKAELDKEKYFGEGIVFLHGKVFQLTYKTKVGFIYDEKTFKRIGEFTIPTKEGWGFTTDGSNLIMSDGTNILTYLDPVSLQVSKTLSVSENGYAKDYLNELEYIHGFIYANVYGTNEIVKINPEDGQITGSLDLSALAEKAKSVSAGSLEMNGIAFDSVSNTIYITGKMWPEIYGLQLK